MDFEPSPPIEAEEGSYLNDYVYLHIILSII